MYEGGQEGHDGGGGELQARKGRVATTDLFTAEPP